MCSLDLSRTILSLSICIFTTALIPASAQEPEETTDSMTVTGSHIRRPELSANSPVVSVSGEEIARRGIVNVEEIVRELPQAVAGISPGVNLGNPGVATIDLRGLGATRTLVLMVGKRFVPYDSDGVVDVNYIPTFLIDRVVVVTGGSSAVYGSYG